MKREIKREKATVFGEALEESPPCAHMRGGLLSQRHFMSRICVAAIVIMMNYIRKRKQRSLWKIQISIERVRGEWNLVEASEAKMEENWRNNGEDGERDNDEVPPRKLQRSSSRSRSWASHHHSRFLSNRRSFRLSFFLELRWRKRTRVIAQLMT